MGEGDQNDKGGRAEEDGEGGPEWGWGGGVRPGDKREADCRERETLRAQLGGTRRKTQTL